MAYLISTRLINPADLAGSEMGKWEETGNLDKRRGHSGPRVDGFFKWKLRDLGARPLLDLCTFLVAVVLSSFSQ